jgi:hypothetical protein
MSNTFFRTLAISGLFAAASFSGLVSCKKSDSGPSAITVKTATTGGKDLAGATAATGVGLTSNVIIHFSRALNLTTVTSSSVTLTPDGSSTPFVGTLTAAGDSVVFDPTNDLTSGTKFNLVLAASIKALDGGTFAGQTFTFTTFGPVNITPPQAANQTAYFAFNGTYNDATGGHNPTASGIISTAFTADRKGNAGAAADFNGSTSLVEVPNGTDLYSPSNTLSAWIRVDTTSGHGLFVMGANFFKGYEIEVDGKGGWFKHGANFGYNASADSNTTEDIFYNGDGKYNANGGWMGHTFKASGNVKQQIAQKWVQIVQTYDATSRVRSLYLNGSLVLQSDFNLWPVGDSKRRVQGARTQVASDLSKTFAFGFAKGRDASFWADTDFGDYAKPNANHFKGQIDDVRFFKVALSATEVQSLYNAEK